MVGRQAGTGEAVSMVDVRYVMADGIQPPQTLQFNSVPRVGDTIWLVVPGTTTRRPYCISQVGWFEHEPSPMLYLSNKGPE